ncbi:serine hydrolase domain-containing protein [Tunicatimonas pelagia]|uniref:serine hydrolase domain-containing protein n=1 Tax=Tunicatimonas pelagia TaxID=931531 RepID=UPI0026671389|nr:serine hydrolase domain-containing protein [Tunicatimonas pelagia]WKN45609.1 serine hydrolase [Tunicatimonas pelagia]
MSKRLFCIVMFLVVLGCETKKESTALEVETENSIAVIMNRVENNILPISKEGEMEEAPQTIASRMTKYNVVGLGIAVFDNNEIVWDKGYGLRNKNPNESVDSNTLFQAASISKPVASVVAFKLVEEKKLDLDENVNRKLVRWQIPDNQFTVREKVTLGRIMSHTAGLSTAGFDGYKKGTDLPTLDQILEGGSLSNSEPVRVIEEPGQSENYSGGGMTILQMLLEDVSEKDFAELANNLIFQPTGMHQSSFDYPLPEKLDSLTANGFSKNEEVIEGGYHVYPEKAAAGLWTTPSDLARFMLSVGRSYRGEKNGLINQATAQKMLTRVPGAGGMGFGIQGEGKSFRFRYSGRNAGFTCYAVSFADTGRGIVLMTNSDTSFPFLHELTKTISREFQWPEMWLW